MIKKIVLVCLIGCVLFPNSIFAQSYRDDRKIMLFSEVIENRAGDILSQKSLLEKIELLVKIQKIIDSYEGSDVIDSSKKDLLNFLYALEEYVADTMVLTEDKVEQIEITVIDDVRCTNCYTDSIISQLESVQSLEDAIIIRKDFADEGVFQYLEDNKIKSLPAIIFNTNEFEDGGQVLPFLQKLSNGEYSLSIGANFDPFATRSDKGFQFVDLKIVQEIEQSSFISGNADSEILWLEYSDLECPFCAQLHNDGTVEKILENYKGDVKFSFQHFPLDFHKNARDAAAATQCVGEQYGASSFYNILNITFGEMGNENFSMIKLYELLEENISGVNIEDIKNCMIRNDIIKKVSGDMQLGQDLFNIMGTPGNVLINTITGEYAIIAGAYPYSSFEEIIDKLLK